MKIICISGHAQYGKDTSATILVSLLKAKGKRVLITHFADTLKYLCQNFFGWDGVKDEAGRTLLQYVGTDVIRAQNPDFWVDFVGDVLGFFGDKWDYVLIPDARFPNEITRLSDRGFETIHMRVARDGFVNPLSAKQRNHSSETALDDVTPDIMLYNNGSIPDLVKNIEALVEGGKI